MITHGTVFDKPIGSTGREVDNLQIGYELSLDIFYCMCKTYNVWYKHQFQTLIIFMFYGGGYVKGEQTDFAET